LSVSHCRKA